jgi:3-deoxy-7-phosphoheptulonate synthase
MNWTPESWKSREARQQPNYVCDKAFYNVKAKLKSWPGLVNYKEIDQLKDRLAMASRGEAFILQGGDCAERFRDCTAEMIQSKLNILLQMSVILGWGLEKPIVRIGRIAGQYGKPRTQTHEWQGGREIPVYRGDAVNDYEASESARDHDPNRLALAYQYSSMTLNYIRSLCKTGFSDLFNRSNWDIGFPLSSSIGDAYEKTIEQIRGAIGFFESMGIRSESFSNLEFFTSHEGLILDYEEGLCRLYNDKWYNLSAHMLWIGERTRHLDGAHIEFFRGVANPVGVKVGPESCPDEISKMLDILNPKNESGKIMLITRFGCDHLERLDRLVTKIVQSGQTVVWSSDPMHGNSVLSSMGRKTRDFSKILLELKSTAQCLKENGSFLGGVHFELTSENVTECIGGLSKLDFDDLHLRYHTWCDPRLNHSQSLEMAFHLNEMLGGKKSFLPSSL